MEIPLKYVLTMTDIFVHADPNTGKPDMYNPVVAKIDDHVYVPESFPTTVTAEYVLSELGVYGDLGMRIGPTVDINHFIRTGELRGRDYSTRDRVATFWNRIVLSITEGGSNG